jgi:hypothetical protein
MEITIVSVTAILGLFFGMLLLLELGLRLGSRRLAVDEGGSRAGLGAVEGAVFALMGLLVAFSFSGAASRFDARRRMIVDEANAIGTAWLRLDLLPAGSQPGLRELFRGYLDARISIYQKLPDLAAARAEFARANSLQSQIWSNATAAVQQAPPPVMGTVLPALNQMFDVATTRTTATEFHPPAIIFAMLGGLTLVSALLAGFAMAGSKARSWVHVLGFALIMTITIYVILDLEFPRVGMIRIDATDQVLSDLRAGMK